MTGSGNPRSNTEGDVVLIYYKDEPSVYARIELIEPDVKKGWYQVSLLMLTLPPQPVTWILREEYINGEPFTMGGQPLRIEAVPIASPARDSAEPSPSTGGEGLPGGGPAKVVPLRKKTTRT